LKQYHQQRNLKTSMASVDDRNAELSNWNTEVITVITISLVLYYQHMKKTRKKHS